MKRLKKNKEGITLVALVVKIIVLLILAGVAINLTIGNKGLFSRAKLAINEWENATKTEKSEIDNLIKKMDSLEKGLPSNVVIYYIDKDKTYEDEIEEGEDCLQIKNFTPIKEGWTFLGWREDKEAKEEVLSKKEKGERGVILYAVYKQERNIIFNGNGQTSGSIEAKTEIAYYNGAGITRNPIITLISEGLNKMYYHLEEWAVDSIQGDKYKVGEKLEIGKDVTLYAIWKEHLEEVDLKIGERTYGVPSNTTIDKATARTFNVNNYVVGLAYDNYYNPTFVSDYSVNSSRIWQKAYRGYGVGIPFLADSNNTYKVDNTESNTLVYMLYYALNGQCVQTNYYSYSKYSTAPSNAYYGVMTVFSPSGGTEQYVNNLKLFKVL